jgi:hypothetical protein
MSRREVQEEIKALSLKLEDLDRRSAELVQQGDGFERLCQEASTLGQDLLKAVHVSAGLGPEHADTLKALGRKLHLTETVRDVADAGQTEQSVVLLVSEASREIARIAASLT